MSYLTAAEAAKLSEEAIANEPTRELNEYEFKHLESILESVKSRDALLRRRIHLPQERLSAPLKRELLALGFRFDIPPIQVGSSTHSFLVW